MNNYAIYCYLLFNFSSYKTINNDFGVIRQMLYNVNINPTALGVLKDITIYLQPLHFMVYLTIYDHVLYSHKDLKA